MKESPVSDRANRLVACPSSEAQLVLSTGDDSSPIKHPLYWSAETAWEWEIKYQWPEDKRAVGRPK
jgi:hypothetical protein